MSTETPREQRHRILAEITVLASEVDALLKLPADDNLVQRRLDISQRRKQLTTLQGDLYTLTSNAVICDRLDEIEEQNRKILSMMGEGPGSPEANRLAWEQAQTTLNLLKDTLNILKDTGKKCTPPIDFAETNEQ